MKEWKERVLGEVARVINGKTPAGSDKRSTGHPVLKVKDILDTGGFRGVFDSFVDHGLAEKNSDKWVQIGDILILNAAHNAAYVGSKIYRETGDAVGALATGEWLIIRADPDALDPCFAYYWTISSSTRHRLKLAVKGIHLYPRDVARFTIPLPPLPEQKRIAAILDKADAVRRKRARALKLADEFLKSAFLDIVGPRARQYKTWPEQTVEELAEKRKGSMRTGPFGSNLRHSEFVDHGIAVLGIDNAVHNRFEWGERRFITEEKYEKLKRYTVFPGDVIITIMGTTGRSAVIPEDIPTAITTKHLAAISVNRDVIFPEFLAFAVRENPDVLNQIRTANKGAIMDGLNLTIIKKLRVRLPPLYVQERFVSVVSRMEEMRRGLTKNRRSAADLFHSLVQRAFRGEL